MGKKCPHGRRKSFCIECGGASICQHGRRKHQCKACGGSSICQHGRIKSTCKPCGGASFCQHGRLKRGCNACNPVGHLSTLMRARLIHGLKSTGIEKRQKTVKYIGTSYADLKERLQKKMDLWNSTHDAESHMTWNNVHVDHIKPIDCAKEDHPYHSPIEELTHFTNLQPLLKEDNLSKSAKWSSAADVHWRNNIYLNDKYDAIFMLA